MDCCFLGVDEAAHKLCTFTLLSAPGKKLSFALTADRLTPAGTSSCPAVSSTSMENTRDGSVRSLSIRNTSTSSPRSAKSAASALKRTAWEYRPPNGFDFLYLIYISAHICHIVWLTYLILLISTPKQVTEHYSSCAWWLAVFIEMRTCSLPMWLGGIVMAAFLVWFWLRAFVACRLAHSLPMFPASLYSQLSNNSIPLPKKKKEEETRTEILLRVKLRGLWATEFKNKEAAELNTLWPSVPSVGHAAKILYPTLPIMHLDSVNRPIFQTPHPQVVTLTCC